MCLVCCSSCGCRQHKVADQLVQFRSLTDIVSVKRTLGGAFSVFGRRRVFRGIPVEEDEEQEDEEEEREKGEVQEEREKEEEGGVEVGAGDGDSAALPNSASGSSESCVGTPRAGEDGDGGALAKKALNASVAANGCGGAAVDESAGEGGGLGADGPSCRPSPRGQRGEEIVDEVSRRKLFHERGRGRAGFCTPDRGLMCPLSPCAPLRRVLYVRRVLLTNTPTVPFSAVCASVETAAGSGPRREGGAPRACRPRHRRRAHVG